MSSSHRVLRDILSRRRVQRRSGVYEIVLESTDDSVRDRAAGRADAGEGGRRAAGRATGFLYEPKWDGFRALVFCGATDVYIQSRDLRPLDRYFPDLHAVFRERLPGRVCHRRGDRDCHAAGARLRRPAAPAASRGVARREAGRRRRRRASSASTCWPSTDVDLRSQPQSERRGRLEALLGGSAPPIYLTPMTRDRARRGRVARSLRGRGPRRRDRQACRRHTTSPASAR